MLLTYSTTQEVLECRLKSRQEDAIKNLDSIPP